MKAAKVPYLKKAQSHFNEVMRLNGERDGIDTLARRSPATSTRIRPQGCTWSMTRTPSCTAPA